MSKRDNQTQEDLLGTIATKSGEWGATSLTYKLALGPGSSDYINGPIHIPC